MSELVWNPELPDRAAAEVDSQISRPHGQATDIAVPLTRRELRQQRERDEAAALAEASPLVELGFVLAEASAEASAEAETEPEPQSTAAPVTQPGATDPAEWVELADTIVASPAPLPLRPRSAAKSRRKRPRATASTRPTSRPTTSEFPSMSRRPKIHGRALVAKLMSFAAMVGVAGMFVATSVPASAFDTPFRAGLAQSAVATEQQTSEVQLLAVQQADELAAKALAKDDYTTLSLSDSVRNRFNNQAFTFTNNPNGTIQWPFATSVPISSGFGVRAACSFCSSQHEGLDFAPGFGAPIQAIADGVVSDVIVSSGGYGVHILIDHVVDGQNVQSLYAHMRWGSPAVAKGQAVRVGQYLGDVGSTGASTGPHLHLEIHVEGTPVDPYVWLKANAN